MLQLLLHNTDQNLVMWPHLTREPRNAIFILGRIMLGYESRFSYYGRKEKWVAVCSYQSLPYRYIHKGRVWVASNCSITGKMAVPHTGKLGGVLHLWALSKYLNNVIKHPLNSVCILEFHWLAHADGERVEVPFFENCSKSKLRASLSRDYAMYGM